MNESKRPLALPSVSTAEDADVIIIDGAEGLRRQTIADHKAQLSSQFTEFPEAFNPATSDNGGLVKVNTSDSPGVTPTVYKKSEVDAELFNISAARNGSTDDLAIISAALTASNKIRFRSGSHYISDNLTIGATKVLIFEPGAKLKPASGKKITIYGDVQAGRYEIFDYSAGGSCVFGLNGIGTPQNEREMFPEWWGATGDNSTNNDTPFSRICGVTASENCGLFLLGSPYYNFVAGFTPHSKQTFEGVPGRETRLQYAPVADGTFITIPNSSFDIRFKSIQLHSLITSGTVRTTAVGVANDAHIANNINFQDCIISNFNKRGIDAGGWIDCAILQTRFENISNLAAYGGTGIGPATCIFARSYLNAVTIDDKCEASNCEQFFKNTAASASTTIGNCDFDQTQTAGTGSDAISGLEPFIYVQGRNIRVVNNYFEGIRGDDPNAMVFCTNADNPQINFNYMTNLRGVSNVANVFINISSGVQGANVGGNEMLGSPGTAYLLVNASSGKVTTFPENIYRDASGVQFATRAAIKSRIRPVATDILLPDGMHWARVNTFWSITGTAGVQYPLGIGRELNGTTPAANDGVGLKVEMENAASPTPALKIVGREHWIWSVATAGVETAHKVIQLLIAGNLTEVGRWISNGLKFMGGPTITVGTGVPASSEPNGSLFLRTDGTGPNIYARENGAWVAK